MSLITMSEYFHAEQRAKDTLDVYFPDGSIIYGLFLGLSQTTEGFSTENHHIQCFTISKGKIENVSREVAIVLECKSDKYGAVIIDGTIRDIAEKLSKLLNRKIEYACL